MSKDREQLIAEAVLGNAREALDKRANFLSSALFALKWVPRPGLGTVAVDAGYRCYYDPKVVIGWSEDELGNATLEALIGSLAHEVEHPVRRHFERASALGVQPGEQSKDWNAASDAEINDDLIRDGYVLPKGYGIFPSTLEQPNGKIAEHYYKAIRKQRKANEKLAREELKAKAEAEAEKAEQDKQDKQEDDAGEPDAGDEGEDGDSGDAGDEDGEEDSEDGAEGAGGDSEATDGQGDAQDGDGTGSGAEGDDEAEGAGGGWQNPFDPLDKGEGDNDFHDCGSAADGNPRDYEEPEDSEEYPAVPEGVRSVIEDQVVKAILEAGQGRGTIPGHWQAWAKERSEVVVKPLTWQTILRRFVASSTERQRGATDYTFNRPNRRAMASKSPIIQPSLYDPRLTVAIQIDTSGSVTDRELRAALAEVEQIIKTISSVDKVQVISCDSRVQTDQKVARAAQVRLGGRGGTDMRVGIEYLTKQAKKPAVIIVITDGETPWPTRKGKIPVVACLTRPWRYSKPPAWIKTVVMKNP